MSAQPSSIAAVDPATTIAVTTAGVVTALLAALVKNGTLDAQDFLRNLDALAAQPGQDAQTPEEQQIEKRVFDLVRAAVAQPTGVDHE